MSVNLAAMAAEHDPTDLVELDLDGIRWKGYASLIPTLIPIDSIEPHPRNPRRGNLDAIARSLDAFGQTKSIVVQASTRYVVAGNHARKGALERLDWTYIAATVGEMDDATALDYLLADNRSSDLATYDGDLLAELVVDADARGDIERTGYSKNDLGAILAENEERAAAALAGGGGGGGEKPHRETADAAMREVVLLFEAEQHAEFARFAKMLQREWSTGGTIETVFRAVKEAAERL